MADVEAKAEGKKGCGCALTILSAARTEPEADTSHFSGGRLVAIVCSAQVLVQIGAYFWPALLPEMMRRWSLSNSEAGWITAIFYAAYMVSVPVLVTLTDRVDAKRVYLFGVGCSVAGPSAVRPVRRRLLVGDGDCAPSPAWAGPAPT